MYDEKKTQKTSYMRSPIRRSVETFRLGSRTNAINATHKAIPIKSMSTQLPVNTQMHTTVIDNVKLNSSAVVNRPQNPSDIRFPSEHGRIRYWHMGKRRNASAMVAITEIKLLSFKRFISKLTNSLAVHTVKSICIESKKKNITRREIDAPRGKHKAWVASSVAKPASPENIPKNLT